MSRYYKIDTRGKHWIQRVNGVPAWQASDKGRIIYDLITDSMYFANNVQWQAGGKYSDIPQNTILLIESDVALTGYSLLINKEDMVVYIEKGTGAGGSAGGIDKAGGTWSQPNHIHSVGNHTHTVVNHSHSLNSHVHAQQGSTSYQGGTEDQGGGSNTAAPGHSHTLSGNTGGAAGSTGADSTPTNSGGPGNTGNDNMGSAWRPKGRNFTRQQRT